MKKILIYNWIAFNEAEGKGGGVTVYTKNLMEELIKTGEWEVFFISSGRAYNLNRYETYIVETENVFQEKCHSYEIVNSPILSSARLSHPYPKVSCQDEITRNVLERFIEEQGGFDVIHFQNLEGLSIKVLELKEKFKETKFIYTAHNYYMVCPQVMLWQEDSRNCSDYRDGKGCILCCPKDVHFLKVMFNQFLTREEKKGRFLPELNHIQTALASYYRKYEQLDLEREKGLEEDAEAYRNFRRKNVEFVNRYMDQVIAVSERVREILIQFGVKPEKVCTCYIGTKVARQQIGFQRISFRGAVFNLCYLGYAKTMKGFFFLLDALEMMPEELARRIGLVFGTKFNDNETLNRVSNLGKRFASCKIYNGYRHEDFDEILKEVHLGIVPPLWEDNLPQVAMEMQAFGIPVLCSNLGGAKELGRLEQFVFKAGDKEDFIDKVAYLLSNPGALEKYWENAQRLITMQEHIVELVKIYEG